MQNRMTEQITLDPFINRTGDIWHLFVKGDLSDMLYGYMFDGKFSPEEGHHYDASKILLDPYAKVCVYACRPLLFQLLSRIWNCFWGAAKKVGKSFS